MIHFEATSSIQTADRAYQHPAKTGNLGQSEISMISLQETKINSSINQAIARHKSIAKMASTKCNATILKTALIAIGTFGAIAMSAAFGFLTYGLGLVASAVWMNYAIFSITAFLGIAGAVLDLSNETPLLATIKQSRQKARQHRTIAADLETAKVQLKNPTFRNLLSSRCGEQVDATTLIQYKEMYNAQCEEMFGMVLKQAPTT